MDRIKVELLHVTPKEVVIKAVAKPYKNETADLKLVKKVGMLYKHESILEHITLNFEILGISRLCLQELARHRIASYTVESTRFTLQKLDMNNFDLTDYFVFPDELCDNQDYHDKCYNDLYELSELDLKNDLKKYFLLENFKTNLIMTINLRSFLNFLNLREAKEAHFEIKHLAKLMREEASKTYIKELIG